MIDWQEGMSKYPAILIAGPTASGKSQLALDIAEKVDGVIVNADSMQVYEDLRVLTARPSENDLETAPHALYGFVPGHTPYSAGRFAQDAEKVIDKMIASTGMKDLREHIVTRKIITPTGWQDANAAARASCT